MCRRFSLTSPEKLADHFGLKNIPDLKPRFNIAPSQMIPAILNESHYHNHLTMMRWGLIPSWAKDEKIGYKMINARAETVAEKPAFKFAFKHRRCLIPADGFYEWLHEGPNKQPYFICMKDKGLFAFVGLWESWKNPATQETIESCTIITTSANSLVGKIHDRMPAIIQPEQYGSWLDLEEKKTQDLLFLLKPFPDTKMIAYPVGKRVNIPQNDTVACLEPLRENSG